MSMSGFRPDTRSGNAVVLLFSLPFLVVGAIMGSMLFGGVMESWRARSWVEVPATLDGVDLQTQRGSKGTITFRTVATYHYTWQDRTIRGQRVSFHDGFDNVGSFHQDVFNRLQAARAAGATVTAYVDPAAPTSAVLHRQLRAELVVFNAFFVLAFGGFGLGVLATGILGARRALALAASRARHPGRPWLWRRDWERGVVKDDSTRSVAPLAVFAAVWESTTVSPSSSWRRRDTATSVPVAVDLPASAPASSVPDGEDTGVVWSLEARAEVPGVNLGSVFVLPVFRGPSSPSSPS